MSHNPDSIDCRGIDKGTFKQSAWVPPSPTLYITNIPATRHALEGLEATLRQQEGFVPPIRTAKGGAIAFADFAGVQMATNAMNRLRGLQVCGRVPNGIQLSYDKDDSEDRRKEKEAKYIMHEAMKLCQQYHCRLCDFIQICENVTSDRSGAFVMKLTKSLDKLPKRSTDASYVVSEAKQLVELSACKGEVKHIQRDKGVEQQCRLKCDGCSVVIGYRPTPMGEPSPFLYVLPDALNLVSPPPSKDSIKAGWPGAKGPLGTMPLQNNSTATSISGSGGGGSNSNNSSTSSSDSGSREMSRKTSAEDGGEEAASSKRLKTQDAA